MKPTLAYTNKHGELLDRNNQTVIISGVAIPINGPEERMELAARNRELLMWAINNATLVDLYRSLIPQTK